MRLWTIALIGVASITTSFAYADSHDASIGDLVQTALDSGDVEAGERVFRKCKACHQVGEGASARVGPPLNNILGAPLGTSEEFTYSDTVIEMRDAGTTWTIENLDVYLLRPRDFIEGSRMTFPGLRKDEDRANVIAYLASLTEVNE